MAGIPNNAFVESVAHAFVESPAHQRIASGVGFAPSVTYKKGISASYAKIGWKIMQDYPATELERVEFYAQLDQTTNYFNRPHAQLYSSDPGIRRDNLDWAFLRMKYRVRSTPNPLTGTGYYETSTERVMNDYTGAITDTPYENESGYHVASAMTLDDYSITEASGGCYYYAKYTDGFSVKEFWQEFTNPQADADVYSKLLTLWSSKTISLPTVSDGTYGIVFSSAGDGSAEVSSMYCNHFDSTVTPLINGAGESVGPAVEGSFDVGLFAMMADVELEVTGQFALYTYTHNKALAALDRESAKLPFMPKVRVRLYADPANFAANTLQQADIKSLDWWDDVTPNFPDPDP
jgi:hypothetical protein